MKSVERTDNNMNGTENCSRKLILLAQFVRMSSHPPPLDDKLSVLCMSVRRPPVCGCVCLTDFGTKVSPSIFPVIILQHFLVLLLLLLV